MRARARGVIADDLYANMYIRDIVLMSPNIKTMLKPTPQVDIFEHDSPRVFLLAGSKIWSEILKVTV